MKGWRTLILNVLSVLAALLAMQGIEFTPEQQSSVATGAVALIGLVNVIVRHFTSGEAGWRKPGAGRKVPVVLLAVMLLPALTGCGGTSGQALLEAISLEPCEIGYVDVSGTFDVSGNPLVTTNVYVEMREEHTAETIPKDCPGYQESVSDPPPAS